MIRAAVQGWEKARRDLQASTLPPARQRRVLRKLGLHLAKRSRARITRQETVEGGRFAPRRPRREGETPSRKKLLTAFRRHIRVRLDGRTAVIYVGGGILSSWARQHQEGFTEVVRAKLIEISTRKNRRRRHRRSRAGPGEMATRAQARRVQSLGWKKPQKWIMQTYSRRLAGFLIRKEEGRQPKVSWNIVVPQRPFLGASASERAELRDILLAELRRAA